MSEWCRWDFGEGNLGDESVEEEEEDCIQHQGAGVAMADEAEQEKWLEVVERIFLQACSSHGKGKRSTHSMIRPSVTVDSATSVAVISGAPAQIRIHSSTALSLTLR